MSTGRIREAGDAALVLELDAVIDPRVNARAIAAARAVARRAIRGVLDIVPTFRSVGVYFDPRSGCADDVRAALERASDEPLDQGEGALIEIPVAYGGPDGPDLEEVAARAGITTSAVIDRHAAADYRAYMLGFLPGFAYLAHVDPAIAIPRRQTPRVRVAAGSVGIAGQQTGVYPCVSPGGWQIVGRALRSVFDARRSPPSVMASGDRVRFVPVSGEQTQLPDAPRTKGEGSGGDLASNADGPSRASFGPTITVVKPGLLSTIQDRGRWGYQHIGVSVSGAMDLQSHRLANSLVGNGPDAATVEATLVGPELRMETDAVVAITGADVAVSLDGSSVPGHTPLHARAGNVLRFGPRRGGGRAYVAFSGGIQTPGVLGSAATHTRTSMGGIDGRALRAGDRLRLGSANVQRTAPSTGLEPVVVSNGARLRVLTGPQEDLFPSSALEILLGSRFVLSPESDRMGFRLTGERPIPRLAGREMISDVTVTGGIQVPASGQPIVLMADRPTTGGYPQLAVVITADLPRAGQLVPGDWVEFELSSMRDALAALSGQSDGDGGQSSVC